MNELYPSAYPLPLLMQEAKTKATGLRGGGGRGGLRDGKKATGVSQVLNLKRKELSGE